MLAHRVISALATNTTVYITLAELAGRVHVRLLRSRELSARESLHRMVLLTCLSQTETRIMASPTM